MKKYIPDLIPEKHRVLTEYFQELPHKSVANSWDNISWLISTILLLGTFWVVMVNFGFGFFLFFTSFIISPWGHKFLERNLEFVLTKNLKLKTIGVISIFTAVTGIQFSHDLRELQEQNRIAELKRITIQKEIQKKERNRLDSLTLYVTEAEKYQKAKKYQKAINLFKEAQKYSIKSDENRIILGLANSYFDVKDYKKASENLNRIDEKSADIYYKKGVCSNKLGDISQAIVNFKYASDLGNYEAEKEYNRVNPIIRRIIGYQTVCCDGTYSPSNAKGKGACSHHGGVCNWNKPIYEEHRKYEVSNF